MQSAAHPQRRRWDATLSPSPAFVDSLSYASNFFHSPSFFRSMLDFLPPWYWYFLFVGRRYIRLIILRHSTVFVDRSIGRPGQAFSQLNWSSAIKFFTRVWYNPICFYLTQNNATKYAVHNDRSKYNYMYHDRNSCPFVRQLLSIGYHEKVRLHMSKYLTLTSLTFSLKCDVSPVRAPIPKLIVIFHSVCSWKRDYQSQDLLNGIINSLHAFGCTENHVFDGAANAHQI